nr:FAR1 DNA binding domain, zinc finger, SWIM-type, MULE transposase domain, FHY3/FAR1 family [Tanacetum cinerariifolium]
SHNQVDGTFDCSSGHFNRHGFLCRHVFCVFAILGMDNIPENYINCRWRKNPLPDHLREKRHKFLLSKVTDLKKELEIDTPSQNEPKNKDALYEDLLGVKAHVMVGIKNPNKCPNKGHRRFKSVAGKGKAIKKATTNQKVPFKQGECSKCGQMSHNKHTCDENRMSDEEYQSLLKKKKDSIDFLVNESDDEDDKLDEEEVEVADETDKYDEDEDED